METTPAPRTVWGIVEAAPAYVGNVAHLWSWSLNYTDRNNHPMDIAPFPVFLDLIGYYQERIGCKGSVWGVTDCDGLDYMGAHALAKALCDWADRPHEVEAWLDELLGYSITERNTESEEQ